MTAGGAGGGVVGGAGGGVVGGAGGGVVGIGVDEVELARFARTLARTPTIAGRLFTTGELAYGDHAPGRRVERLAARFAAKEAVLKALGAGLGACGFHDIEVVRDEGSGAPALVLRGPAAELANRRGVATWHLSLTHTPARALAFVVATA